jgi:hypothetical protein
MQQLVKQLIVKSAQQLYLNDVQHSCKLTEQKNLVLPLEELGQEPIENHHFSTMVDELLVHNGLLRHWVQRPVEEERVRADFPKLHDRVLQLHIVDFRS